MTNIKIAGQPVLIDATGKIEHWLDHLLPNLLTDTFFCPVEDFPNSNDGDDDFDVKLFASNLPKIPKIRLGSIQWPVVGCYRFARGLFVVDKEALAAILNEAWGLVWTDEDENPIPPNFDKFQPSKNDPVEVEIGEIAPALTLFFYVLPPVKVSEDVWILKIVDSRYFRRQVNGPFSAMQQVSPLLEWSDYFSKVSNLTYSDAGYSVSYAPNSIGEYGAPDKSLGASTSPMALQIDAACYSVGCRPVIRPRQSDSNQSHVICQRAEDATAASMISFGSSKTTGGATEFPVIPKVVEFRTRVAQSYFTGKKLEKTIPIATGGFGPNASISLAMYYQVKLDTENIHSVRGPEGVLDEYCNTIASTFTQAAGWNQLEYDLCVPGIQELSVGGNDDFIEWNWNPSGCFTRLKSLPVSFFPTGLVAQHRPTIDDLANPIPWYSTPRKHCLAITTEVSPGGFYSDTNKAWGSNFVEVQLVDEATIVSGSIGIYRHARAKALVATTSELGSGRMVEVHFCDVPIINDYVNSVFSGWVITDAQDVHLVRFKLNENIDAFGEAEATSDGGTITVKDDVGISAIEDQQGIAWRDGATYRIIHIRQASGGGTEGTAFTLTSSPTYGDFNEIATASATILQPDGSTGASITVKFIGRVRGKIGARGFAIKQAGQWISTSLQQPALRIRATATSNLEPTDTTKSVIVSEAHTSFPFDISQLNATAPTTPIEVDNPKSLFGFTGAKIDLAYNAETDRYFIDSIQKHAWRIKGTLDEDMSPSDTEIKLDYVVGLDGILNDSIVNDGFVMAKNTHHWNGVSGATARAEYNWDVGQWELYQIDCEEEPPEEEEA